MHVLFYLREIVQSSVPFIVVVLRADFKCFPLYHILMPRVVSTNQLACCIAPALHLNSSGLLSSSCLVFGSADIGYGSRSVVDRSWRMMSFSS